MKKFGLALGVLAILFIAMPVAAQNAIGFTGGLNLASISVDPDGENIGTLVGFGVGGVLDLRLAENVMLHLQPMYLQKGAKDDTEGSDDKLKFAYLEVPAMVKVAFGTSSARPYIMAGPAIGFLLSAKASSGDEDVDIKDFLKSTDFGLDFGAGVSIPAGNNSFFIEGRYELGLSDIGEDSDEEEDDGGSIKNKGIQIMAGFTFPLGSK